VIWVERIHCKIRKGIDENQRDLPLISGPQGKISGGTPRVHVMYGEVYAASAR